jgi:histidyl-tRNA synthetase
MNPLRVVKGMKDVLPDEVKRWQRLEHVCARTMSLYGFRELRTPYVESTPLFVHAMGDTTDVVEKEMYSFDHHGESLTLRPEGTAGAARAYIEHSVHAREPVTRWWYLGPMFRAENPQRGRYRQFAQVGAEIFGDEGPGCDAEMIDMLVGLLNDLGIGDIQVLVNSIGSAGARASYRRALVEYFEPNRAALSHDSQRRLATNPLRILDSKDERDQRLLADAPTIHACLDAGDQEHFAKLRAYLDELGTPYSVEEKLVRGLDYYTRTLFEIKGPKDKLGAGDTLIGGGRYDNLVGDLGGPSVAAVGFAAGVERLLIASDAEVSSNVIDAVVAALGPAAIAPCLALARDLRSKGIRCEVDTRGTSLKSQLRRANQLGARLVLIVGESELASGIVEVKDLEAHTQEPIAREQVVPIVVDRLVAAQRSVDARAPKGRV